MDRFTRQHAHVYLFNTTQENYDNFSTAKIPNAVLLQVNEVIADFKWTFFDKDKLVVS